MGKVLIVSRTRMRNGVCVGGISIEECNFVRLHTETGANLSDVAPYEIGEIWEMELKDPWNPRKAPHTEDMMVINANLLEKISRDSLSFEIKRTSVPISKGDIEDVFNRCLKFTSKGKGYVNCENVPDNSVAFWICDDDLIPVEDYGRTIFRYKNKRIPFVGFQNVERIKAGTLIRLSLANWWSPEDDDCEERCYLQLSGWYK